MKFATEQEYQRWCLQRAHGVAPALVSAVPSSPSPRRPWWPYRSKTEWRYAEVLERWQQTGQILRWRYEALRLALAPQTTLTVDFLVTPVLNAVDQRLRFDEVKGATWFREDGWQKLKIAAALYPEFRFVRVQWKDNAWQYLEVPSV